MSAADADAQERPAFGDLVEGRPLDGEQNRMAHRERSHADRAQANFLGVRGECREHGDRFQTRLMNQAVADPNRFEHARLFGNRGAFDQLVDLGEAEQRAAIGQAQAPFYRQVSHHFPVHS